MGENFGNEWNLVDLSNISVCNFSGVAVSSSGQYQSAICNNNEPIFISIDYGCNWNVVFRATRILNANFISKKIRALPPYNL